MTPYPLSLESGNLFAVYANDQFVSRHEDYQGAIDAVKTIAESMEKLHASIKRQPDITGFTIVSYQRGYEWDQASGTYLQLYTEEEAMQEFPEEFSKG